MDGMTDGKRKQGDREGLMDVIEKQIKKLRVSVSPGELRLRNDLSELRLGLAGLPCRVLRVDDLSVFVFFLDARVPFQFIVRASQRYPHVPPDVLYSRSTRLHFSFSNASYACEADEAVDGDWAELEREAFGLAARWTAVMGLSDTILFISAARAAIYQGDFAAGGEAMVIEAEDKDAEGVTDLEES